MKFTILTPALLAALATSANAFTYSTNTDAQSCTLVSNLFYCDAHEAEAACTADALHMCEWADGSCGLKEASISALYTDALITPIYNAQMTGYSSEYTTAASACHASANTDKATCNGVDGCAWDPNAGDDGSCQLSAAKMKTYLTDQSAPKGVIAFGYAMKFGDTVCGVETAEAACNAIDGCEWDSEESKCDHPLEQIFEDASETCGTEGDFAGAGAAAGITSGAADSASRFAVLAASAVAAASLLA